ncbi:SWIM zinc finger family protein [Streptomyces sp. TRM S81-3]|uniref:SWIM zinc finger family protein n=1 Tax=Streptomyces griseicoloratus TaxID=2752516 RepID=A0A926QRE4_9ACTN|nr:SWIM zinc finger family protein [Streptomyces griseicoloratus]MBD0421358.1 SWIM zinc finger family protein [Streptomyces griseicoloratus]
MNPLLPPVAPAVTAELVAALTPRLRKRLDAGVAKVAGRPTVREGDVVRIALDDDTVLELHAPGGVVTSAEAIRCGCLLAPDCLHRAAAASAAPVADPVTHPVADPITGPVADPIAGPVTDPIAEPVANPVAGPVVGPVDTSAPSTGAPQPQADPPQPRPAPAPARPLTASARSAGESPASAAEGTTAPTAEPETATAAQRTAAAALRDAAAAVLEAGAEGAGAVLQAELLRAAHTARLAGLPRAAGRAVAVVTALRAARSADPGFRLPDLAAALREVLRIAHRLPRATGPELAALRGTVRQSYTPDGSLRLYGLFSEPVLTATGYAGAVTWTADAEGRLYTVSDVAPGGAGRATGAAGRSVRIGDTALTHRELSRAGLAVSGATVSPSGRLGAGAGVRAVRASGASWHAEPLDGLWAVPVAEQAARALTTDQDLLFLDVVLTGTVRESAGVCLVADCGGLTLRLAAAHDDPALPHRDNLGLLASATGARLRVVARLTPAPFPRAVLLATSLPADPETRVDLGLDRLLRADLPAVPMPSVPAVPAPDEAPVHVLRRRVHQAASGGRRMLAFPGSRDADTARLRRHGLATAGELLDELHSAAAHRSRDPFGRLLPADTARFAHAWLAAAVCTEELDRALCAVAWGATLPLPSPSPG